MGNMSFTGIMTPKDKTIDLLYFKGNINGISIDLTSSKYIGKDNNFEIYVSIAK